MGNLEDEVYNRALRHYRMTGEELDPILDEIERVSGSAKAIGFRELFLHREFPDKLVLIGAYRKLTKNELSPT
jgi:hypothetical protein